MGATRVVITVVFSLFLCEAVAVPLLVNITSGPLLGRWMPSRDGRQYSSFEGIPFASVPRRFEEPQTPDNWTETRRADYPRSHCPQIDPRSKWYSDATENCLFLNVFVPKENKDMASLPVMVWIHGGAYKEGSGSSYGPKYFMDVDVIVVTFNYRLGAFGFLSTDDEVVPGNMALKDMIMALKWVQSNIHQFGGDPKNVTIFGESAGGAAAHLLSISPAARGLFLRAISSSGTALCPWSFRPEGLSVTKTLAAKLNCTVNESKSMVACLRERSIREILDAQEDEFNFAPSFTPVLDKRAGPNAILPNHPKKLIRKCANTPMIIGLNKHEGLVFALRIMNDGNLMNRLNYNWEALITKMLGFDRHVKTEDIPQIAAGIHQLYFKGENISAESWTNVTNLFSEYMFYLGVKDAIVSHANKNCPVYAYMFSYQGDFSFSGIPHEGPTHSDDNQYLFQSLRQPSPAWPDFNEGSTDEQFSRDFLSLWTSFALQGRPRPWHGSDWSRIKAHDTKGGISSVLTLYGINIDASDLKESEEILKRLEFWNSVLSRGHVYSVGIFVYIPAAILALRMFM